MPYGREIEPEVTFTPGSITSSGIFRPCSPRSRDSLFAPIGFDVAPATRVVWQFVIQEGRLMMTFRGAAEEQRVNELAALLGLEKSEVLRRAVNQLYELYQQEFHAYDWLAPHLDALPASGRSDISAQRKGAWEDIYAERSGLRR